MRILVLLVIFTLPAVAQSSRIKQIFANASDLASAGRFEDALNQYYDVLERAKDEPLSPKLRARIYYNLGVCEYRLGRAQRAVVDLEAAIAADRADPRAHYALGMSESALGNWPRARAAFVRALSLEPQNAEIWFDAAFAYIGETDLEKAEAAFRNAISYGSVDAAFGHNNIGVILAFRGDLAAAKKEFEAAYKTSGRNLKMALANLKLCESFVSGRETSLLAFAGRAGRNNQSL